MPGAWRGKPGALVSRLKGTPAGQTWSAGESGITSGRSSPGERDGGGGGERSVSAAQPWGRRLRARGCGEREREGERSRSAPAGRLLLPDTRCSERAGVQQ